MMQQITAKKLANTNDKSILILDIREYDQFTDWHITGSQNIDVYGDIWGKNFEKVKQKLIQLPKDKKIVTVCNAGVTSQKASELLESLGYETLVLENGMMGWNSLHQSVNVINKGDLFLEQIIRPGKGCLSYLMGSNSTKECFIVDPSYYADEYIELAKELNFTIKGVIETHVHADHLSGAKLLANTLNTKYYVSGRDYKAKTGFIDLISKGEIEIGKNKIKIIESPGHTGGSLCFLVNDIALLTGDSLFLDSVGRPDLGRNKEDIESGAKKLYSTLEKIKDLNGDLYILPAHFTKYDKVPIYGKLSSILSNNELLKINSEQVFVNNILNNAPKTPPNYEQIKSINTNSLEITKMEVEKLEFGPNRCASN